MCSCPVSTKKELEDDTQQLNGDVGIHCDSAMERACRSNSILSRPQKWKKESSPIPVSMGLQIRETKHELKIN